ncbi:hypothetical protein SCHPADRAFT_1000707 [Schizopora paradoxa]|uniref:Formin GTPase-binding domain-containing protein n=1 Tax=Schizopora paradoxa TaxID=27342 RepID=A0A0H2RVE7_9AGAM|nr:hypothetical protein SCHPADRAFT_1000707 [Schizopora paradoxa]
MFRGFIPGKRVASVDLSASRDEGKENRDPSRVAAGKADAVKNNTKSEGKDSNEMVQAFDKLLDDLQIPQALRPKLNGMEPSVKAAMLRSSHCLTLAGTTPSPQSSPKKTPSKPNTLRKTRSTDSLSSPRPPVPPFVLDFPHPPQSTGRFLGAAMKSTSSLGFFAEDNSATANSTSHSLFGSPSRHSRGMSLDVSYTQIERPSGMKTKDKASKDLSPAKYCNLLVSTSTLQLDIESVKKLRLLLRNESASWTETFLQLGGYAALLTRLNEILEVEWREEQHDDQILHELLRCFKALNTSAIGCAALRSASPAPYQALIRLLYSDKKPGDVPTRQLIVELILGIIDLYPVMVPSPSKINSTQVGAAFTCDSLMGEPGRHSFSEQCTPPRPSRPRAQSTSSAFPSPYRNLFSFLRGLLLTPAPPPSEGRVSEVDPHEFISSLHIPRIYKTYVQVLLEICRDYFWVFCHSSNTLWNLDDIDESRVEKPRAPGGMTGGVEFEAMGYLVTHLKLLNAMAKLAADSSRHLPMDHELSAHRFHSDMFASGLEKALLVVRKASTTYYPTLHLEIARYVHAAGQAQFELPWTISRLSGPPPAGMAKPGRSARERERERSNRNSTMTTSSAKSGARRTAGGKTTASAPGTPARVKTKSD